MSICEFYAGIYVGVPLSSRSIAKSLQSQGILDSALPELYAAVIVFSVKARAYFEARGTYLICGVYIIYQYSMLNLNQGSKDLQAHCSHSISNFDLLLRKSTQKRGLFENVQTLLPWKGLGVWFLI